MPRLIQKFGGAALADADHIRAAAKLVADSVRAGHQVIVTVSAMGGDTDRLLRMAPEVSNSADGPELDRLITAGEYKSTALFSLALQGVGVRAQSLTGGEAGIITDSAHAEARILDVRPDRIRQALDCGCVPVVGGAQGISTDGDVTFIGRGGTDTTAVALAGALDADACELYTDVQGVFTADPSIVSDARLLRRISFEQMLAMCAAGCPKPATHAVEMACARQVPLRVRCASSEDPGTLIGNDSNHADVEVLAVIGNGERVSLIGHAEPAALQARAADALAGAGIEHGEPDAGRLRLTWTVPQTRAQDAVSILHQAFDPGARRGQVPPGSPRRRTEVHVRLPAEGRHRSAQRSGHGD